MEVARDSSDFSSLVSRPTTAATPALSIADDDPSIEFTTLKRLLHTINTIQGDFFTVFNIPAEQVGLLDDWREKNHRNIRFRRFYAATRTLLIVIPTGPHEGMHLRLYLEINDKISAMGNSKSWDVMGAQTWYYYRPGVASGGDGVRDSGQGDSSGGPYPQRTLGGWPTLVIEAGYSQSLQSLRAVGQWWFSASQHQVKIVLLCKMSVHAREIRIERWEEVLPPARVGVTTTRSSMQAMQPVCRQVLTLTLLPGRSHSDPTSYEVVRDPLVLEYVLLFLEPPGPGQGDIVLDASDLRRFASKVWGRFTAERLREVLGV